MSDFSPGAARKRTPRQRAIGAAATLRAIRVARDRHARLENARIARLEDEHRQRLEGQR